MGLPVDFVCVTDNTELRSEDYKIMLVKRKFGDVTKNARDVKVNGISGIENYDVAIWHDSSVELDCKQLPLLVQSVQEKILSTFKHKDNCVYSEGRSCIQLRKDSSLRIAFQLLFYALFYSYPVRNGLYETTMVCYNVPRYFGSDLNRKWWNLIHWLSRRDQLSLPVAIFRANFSDQIGVLKGVGFDNPYSIYRGHRYYYYQGGLNAAKEPELLRKLSLWTVYRIEKHLSAKSRTAPKTI